MNKEELEKLQQNLEGLEDDKKVLEKERKLYATQLKMRQMGVKYHKQLVASLTKMPNHQSVVNDEKRKLKQSEAGEAYAVGELRRVNKRLKEVNIMISEVKKQISDGKREHNRTRATNVQYENRMRAIHNKKTHTKGIDELKRLAEQTREERLKNR